MASVLEELRKTSQTGLLELVKMHLSFLIEVSSEEMEKIYAYVNTNNNNNTNNSNNGQVNDKQHLQTTSNSKKDDKKDAQSKKKEAASNIFGKPLTNASLEQAMSLVDFINKNDNFNIEGIFRKSGQMLRQQELRNLLNCGVKVDLEANRFTPLDCSCVLKEFIQKLPEPLLTNNHFEYYYELALTIKRDTPYEELEAKNAKRLKIVQLLLHLIPDLNRQFFVSLMALLNRVASARDVTLMDERSLATIFGQHVLCPRTLSPKQVQDKIEIITDAMEFMLLNYDKLFNGPLELVIDAKKKLKKLADRNLNKIHQSATKQSNKLNSKSSGRFGNGDNINAKYNDNNDDDDDDLGDDENNTVVTFCQQSSETVTDRELAKLYASVQAMPDTPHKRKLIKQFNKQNGFGTPMHVTGQKQSSAKWRSLLPWLSK